MISLIVGTVNRTVELDRLLASLDAQTYRDFEVVIVDQNLDDRVADVLWRHPALRIKHVRSGLGLSRARNVGLRVASGSIYGIPDDDCWYPPELLLSVSSWFEEHPHFDALFAAVRNEHGVLHGPRKRSGEGRECDKDSVWYNGISTNAFWRSSLVDEVSNFDEGLGVGSGTKFQSGEETDFFLRALEHGYRMWFEPRFFVCHPSPKGIEGRILERSYACAVGTGYVLRRHGWSAYKLARDFLGYALAGTFVAACRLDGGTARIRFARAAGIVVGYFSFGRQKRPEPGLGRVERAAANGRDSAG